MTYRLSPPPIDQKLVVGDPPGAKAGWRQNRADVAETGAAEDDVQNFFKACGETAADYWKRVDAAIEANAYAPKGASALPDDSAERENIPLCTGVFDYFTAALAEVAKASKAGNDQHNPGQPLHWARGKSMDHANKLLRHLADRGLKDSKGIRHSAYMAWRALALLQQEMEDDGAPVSRGSR